MPAVALVQKKLLHILFFLFPLTFLCQTKTFKEVNNKWGIKEKEQIIIKPVYDTIFNFDTTGKVCLACFKQKSVNANRFIKTPNITYKCNYLDKKGKFLTIKLENGDTTSIFTLLKVSPKQLRENDKYFIAAIKTNKYLLDKDFKQITVKPYTEIYYTNDYRFFMAEIVNEGNVILKGLIDVNEKEIVPFLYSNVKINSRDSLIVGCSAGIGFNREDDIFNFDGKKLDSYKRHIDMAIKGYVIHKIFEPKEYYIIYNTTTKEENIVYSEEMQLYTTDELLMRNDDHWFTYNLITHKKKSFDYKQYKKQHSEKN